MVVVFNFRVHAFQHFLDIANHTAVHHNIFIDFRRVYIYLDNLRIFRKGLCISHDTVTKPGAYGNQQITVGNSQV